MTLRWMYDASTPPVNPPHLYCAAGYIGGNTPHVWTPQEWAEQWSPYRLPIFTASNRVDTVFQAQSDATAIAIELTRLGVPYGKTVAVDIETRVYENYLDELNEGVRPWLLMTYGSVSTLLQNMRTSGGRWGAHWTDSIETAIQAIESGEFEALQWADDVMLGKPYDLSVISSEVPLWVR